MTTDTPTMTTDELDADLLTLMLDRAASRPQAAVLPRRGNQLARQYPDIHDLAQKVNDSDMATRWQALLLSQLVVGDDVDDDVLGGETRTDRIGRLARGINDMAKITGSAKALQAACQHVLAAIKADNPADNDDQTTAIVNPDLLKVLRELIALRDSFSTNAPAEPAKPTTKGKATKTERTAAESIERRFNDSKAA